MRKLVLIILFTFLCRPAFGIWSDYKLLLHCNGADESVVFTDASVAAHGNATVAGTAQVDTAVKKWGTGSLLLDGTGDYLTYADHADWDISTDWTLDLWIKYNSISISFIVEHYESNNDRWRLAYWDGLGFCMPSGGNNIVNLSGGTISDNDWHHVCVVRKAGQYWGMYLDGTQVAYTNDTSMDTFAGNLYIGTWGGGGYSVNGYMDEIRIQHSNYFEAAPVVGLTDTITVPTKEYAEPSYLNPIINNF